MNRNELINHIKKYAKSYWGEDPHLHDVIYLEILKDDFIAKRLYRKLLSQNEDEKHYMIVVKLDGIVFGFHEIIDCRDGTTDWEFSWNDVFNVERHEKNEVAISYTKVDDL